MNISYLILIFIQNKDRTYGSELGQLPGFSALAPSFKLLYYRFIVSHILQTRMHPLARKL